MRATLFRTLNKAILVLSPLLPISRVLSQVSLIGPTTEQSTVFVVGVFVALLLAAAFFSLNPSVAPFQEVHHD